VALQMDDGHVLIYSLLNSKTGIRVSFREKK